MRVRAVALALAVLLLGACGSKSSAPNLPTIQAAHTFALAGFQPSAPVAAGRPVTVSFSIREPDGSTLTSYRRGAGPHTGIHLIIVRGDLSTIIHKHPPLGSGGRIAEQVTFPAPGPYRVVVDAYPNPPLRNFQLFGSIRVAGTYTPQALPRFSPTVTVDGYRFQLHGRPRLKAIEANTLAMTVTDPNGRPATFTPWFGALAHAIFFRAGSLDYFHTHVCAPGATGCTSFLGGATITGSSSTPGNLKVGVLLPAPGSWRLFLQCKVNGHVLTAPFTLRVT